MSHHTAQTLRHRARGLRHLAIEIERSPVLSLHQHADAATWRGTHPQFCVNLLRTHQARLHHDADDLRWQAYLLEQRALEAERLAALHTGHVR
jgi:hypothetical protein